MGVAGRLDIRVDMRPAHFGSAESLNMSAKGPSERLEGNYAQEYRLGRWRDAGEFAPRLVSAIMLMIMNQLSKSLAILKNS